MIFYFSGTGNSRFAANKINETLQDTTVSVNDLIREGKDGEYHSEKPYVFAFPTYAWRIPKIAEAWMRKATFTGNKKAYFVMTCGGGAGNAQRYLKKLCAEIGLTYCGLCAVLMPENYVAMFAVPAAAEARTIIDRAVPKLQTAATSMAQQEMLPQEKVSILSKLMSAVFNGFFYKFFVKANGFYATDACIGCGKCTRVCPLHNVKLEDKSPTWGKDCTHCMACICCCPTEAIEYKKKSQGKPRYYLKEDGTLRK